jgi:hypothetical protein
MINVMTERVTVEERVKIYARKSTIFTTEGIHTVRYSIILQC